MIITVARCHICCFVTCAFSKYTYTCRRFLSMLNAMKVGSRLSSFAFKTCACFGIDYSPGCLYFVRQYATLFPRPSFQLKSNCGSPTWPSCNPDVVYYSSTDRHLLSLIEQMCFGSGSQRKTAVIPILKCRSSARIRARDSPNDVPKSIKQLG